MAYARFISGMKLSLENTIMAGFAIALVAIAAIGVVSYRSTVRFTEDAGWVKHTQEIQTRLAALASSMTEAEAGARGFTITGDKKYLEPHQNAATNAGFEFQKLRTLTADNPRQQTRLDALEPLIAARLKAVNKIIELRRERGFAAAQEETVSGQGDEINAAFRVVVAEMEREESQLMSGREERARASARFTLATVVAGGAMAFLLLAAALLVIRREFAARKRAEALRLSEEQLRLFVDHSPAAIAMFDREMRYLVVSRRWLSDYQLGEANVVGRSHYDIFPDVPARWREIHRRCLAGAVEKCEEDPFPRADGSLDWVRWEIHPWRDAQGGVGGIILFSEVITARKRAEAIIACQTRVLEKIATGAPLAETLDTLLRHMDAIAPGMLCSVLLLDAERQRFQVGAAPSLPDAFNRAIEEEPIRPRAGSCGAAVFRREAVIVEDIATDPLWVDYRDLALAHGFRACWSTPIFDEQRSVLGTFAIYYREPGRPAARHRQCVDLATGLAAIAISRAGSEAELRESEERLRLSVSASNIGLWDWNLATNQVVFSSEWKAQLGYADDELPNRFEEWESRVHPDDLAPTLAQVRAFIENPAARYAVEFRLRHKDGSFRWIFTQAKVLRDPGGRPTRMLGCHVDITERKRAEMALGESEQRLRNILDTMFVFVGLINLDGEIVDVNHAPLAAAELRREDVLGRTVAESFWFAHAPAVQEQVRAALARAARGETMRDDYLIRVGGGQQITIDTTFAPLRDAAGRVTQIVGSAVDITARKQAEQKVVESREQLRALLARLRRAREEERTRVAREIHDELGQLLTALKMDVRWLERKLSEPGLPPALNPLLDRAVAASELADATIATVQKIALELRPGTLDKLGLAAALAEEARRFQERSGVECVVTVADSWPSLPAEIEGELFYICQEALTNVARHARAKRVAIALWACGENLNLEVSDDGSGLGEAELREPHSLGLIGMRERAVQCGGTVEFSRNEPRGTRVAVRVPKAAAASRGERGP